MDIELKAILASVGVMLVVGVVAFLAGVSVGRTDDDHDQLTPA